MDSEVHCKLPTEEKNVDEKFVNAKALKNVMSEKLLLPKCASVGPITSESKREVINFLAEKVTHPTFSPFTPLDGVFDPFAPSGIEQLLLNAPRCIKFRGESQINVVRRLNFETDSKSEEEEEEEMLLEIVYENLLEAIIFSGLPLDDGCKTPDSAKLISGVAETCPQAPIKCSRKSRNFDKTLCTRRLDFLS